MIHPSSAVSNDAKIGNNVKIGPFTNIESNVTIGDNCEIGSCVNISEGTILHKNVKVFHGTSLGTVPQDLKFDNEITTLEIGEGTTVREFAMINRGTKDKYTTRIGKNCLIMAYVHIAHDCIIGDNCILVNNCQIAGHCKIDDYAIISGLVPVHQFTSIGAHSMISGGFRVTKDVPPFITVQGEPLKYAGLNLIGLRRRNFSKEDISIISDSYRIIYRMGYSVKEAVKVIKQELDTNNIYVKEILNFIEKSSRGIIR